MEEKILINLLDYEVTLLDVYKRDGVVVVLLFNEEDYIVCRMIEVTFTPSSRDNTSDVPSEVVSTLLMGTSPYTLISHFAYSNFQGLSLRDVPDIRCGQWVFGLQTSTICSS